MGLSENPTNHPEKQETRRRGDPRVRLCLLKGCERRFRPRQAGQRYCGGPCRKAARTWSRWKAQGRYRATPAGKQQRNGQSRRYRERVRNRKTPADEALSDAARVITPVFFEAGCDRPGCYQGFARRSRSPRQRFCSHQCRRALERVWERERRWPGGRPGPRRRRARRGPLIQTY